MTTVERLVEELIYEVFEAPNALLPLEGSIGDWPEVYFKLRQVRDSVSTKR